VTRALALAVLLASCAPEFTTSSRRLAQGAPPPREPVAERRASYFDAAATRIRREWHVLVVAGGATVLHGKDVQYFGDGHLEHEREYDHGDPAGNWRAWWPNGNPRMEASFGSSEPLPMRWWHENGRLSCEGLARNGSKEGAWTFFHESGAKSAEGAYAAGKREGRWSSWSEAGSPIESIEYRDDLRIGRVPAGSGENPQ